MKAPLEIRMGAGGPRYAIVPPLVHKVGAGCYSSIPGDGGYVPDLEGAASGYELCGECFPRPRTPTRARKSKGRKPKGGK